MKWTREIEILGLKKIILDLLSDGVPRNMTNISKLTGYSFQSVFESIIKLDAWGLISREKNNKRVELR